MTDNPANPPLTRKQLREIRNTGATPVVSREAIDAARQDAVDVPAERAAPEKTEVAPAPLARAAEPAVIGAPPVADSAVDLGVSPLTRRQARQQERIRTASVPVIAPDLLEAPTHHAHAAERTSETGEAAAPADRASVEGVVAESTAHEDGTVADESPAEATDTATERATVSPKLGAELLEAEAVQVDLPPSFDQLLTRAPASTSSTPHALIVSQTPSPQIMAPVNATGEVIITGMLNLPDGLGSTGHAPGSTDGKDVDSVLVDGELPAHSSPTPIAASAAISTVKLPGEIIQPPAPEKGSRLMIALAITAGALALALAAVLILAFVSGVFA
ncbi:hypothetical protein [Microbacterium invictum]|uniref:Uncharacterized protein n=1 Tax=Microbacterium invictum TaxID=515415 RepID=A0ABZ0V7T3_9MICO|nr:hypothetical protein [Microbacterium invictum]WQB68853.1 hypothetical protein T9R20_08965 [Microbacterium invictum]